jgi:hypothetical protein
MEFLEHLVQELSYEAYQVVVEKVVVDILLVIP